MSSSDNHPSLLWVAIPPILFISVYYARKWYFARRLRVHGIGKGAPGFQTSVKRIRVTPEIAARIRRGEEVTPAEIEAATREAELGQEEGMSSGATSIGSTTALGRGVLEERDDRHLINGGSQGKRDESNEWLPPSIITSGKRKKGRR